ncbi:hypothetical protein [Armatimonas sp.]|uniref:hypothetical protein n=1 Tax=Armatimonas sp. TaxID=1872638 RepID=UPI00374DDA48
MPYTPEALSKFLETAYDKLSALTSSLQDAEHHAAIARTNLAARRAEILVQFCGDPKALGVNEATREATIATMLTEERDEMALQERCLAGARNELALHQIEVDHLRAQLRILEVSAGSDRRDIR